VASREVMRNGRTIRPRKKQSQAGFSLFELIITVTITIVLTVMVVPIYSSYTRSYNIKNSADGLVNLISVARMRAAANFSRVEVTCNTTTSQCTLQSKASGASSWSADSNKMTVVLAQGVSFGTPSGVSAGAGGQSSEVPYQGSSAQTISYAVIFNSRGLPIVDNATSTAVSDYALYLLGPNNTAMAVAVDVSGKPTTYTLNGTSWTTATN